MLLEEELPLGGATGLPFSSTYWICVVPVFCALLRAATIVMTVLRFVEVINASAAQIPPTMTRIFLMDIPFMVLTPFPENETKPSLL